MVGDHGLKAGWTLAPLIVDRLLEEIQPGVYIGAYVVQKGDCLYQGRIIGYLHSKNGTRSQWVDTIGQINMGVPTLLPAVVEKDTDLTAAGGPYLVEKALVVMPAARLTIEPGTVIWFERLGIIVRGELRILGTAQSPVQLGSLAVSTWKGIFLDHSAGKNVVQHCTVSGAQYGLRSIASEISISHSHFRENEWGIVAENSRLDLHRCWLRTSAKSGIAARKTELNLTESVVSENGAGGMLLENTRAAIKANNIANNGKWQLKVLDEGGGVKADGNWWGRKHPSEVEIIGSVHIGEALAKPLDLQASTLSP
jgi:hypothetical protein